MKLLLGGPAYRMEVDARHAASQVLFAQRATRPRVIRRRFSTNRDPPVAELLAVGYEHGTPVCYARNHLMRGALESVEAECLGWLDSDCAWDASSMSELLAGLGAWWNRETPAATWSPLLGVPAAQRDGSINVWSKFPDERLRSLRVDGQLSNVGAVGFGGVFFDLRWYRKHWPRGPWFRDSWDDSPGGVGYVSEDVGHCRALAEQHKLPPLIVGAFVVHHARGGEAVPVADSAARGVA